ncbi:MAG: DNA mismatch repair protein MutS [Alphaproteobacteria bacterium]|nr:MAG: DNA mismatch repair protein MutS [Alphaproteobacteria bacterium]
MRDKKSGGILSDHEEKLWQKVTESVRELDSNRAATPLVRRSLYRGLVPDKGDISTLPVGGLMASSLSLRDADHNWHQKLRRGRVKPEGRIDLHGMTEDRAYVALNRYITEAQRQGKRFILVITGKGGVKSGYGQISHSDYGKGRGILQTNVPKWLSHGDLAPRIISYYTANAQHGGAGALYVVLKRNRD